MPTTLETPAPLGKDPVNMLFRSDARFAALRAERVTASQPAVARADRGVSPSALYSFSSHDPGQPEALAAMDAAPRGGVRAQSAASRASLSESRPRVPRRGQNAGAPQGSAPPFRDTTGVKAAGTLSCRRALQRQAVSSCGLTSGLGRVLPEDSGGCASRANVELLEDVLDVLSHGVW